MVSPARQFPSRLPSEAPSPGLAWYLPAICPDWHGYVPDPSSLGNFHVWQAVLSVGNTSWDPSGVILLGVETSENPVKSTA